MKVLKPEPIKLITAILFSDDKLLERGLSTLQESFDNHIDYKSKAIPFTHTEFYNQEMGDNLKRIIISFNKLVYPDQMVQLKNKTLTIEDSFSHNEARQLNFDPGFLDYTKVVLLSIKPGAQKIYLGDGIYADMILYYQKGDYTSFIWTFPDFKSGTYSKDLVEIRRLYKQQVNLEKPLMEGKHEI
jgi:hypothetical protein